MSMGSMLTGSLGAGHHLAVDFETASRPAVAITAFPDGDADDLGDRTFHRQTDASMFARECGERAA